MNQKTSRLEKYIGYQFSNLDLLSRALSHRSVGAENNERLEFLGDSLLGVIVSEALYVQFPSASEGVLTRMRSQLVRGDTLAEIAKEFELGDYLNLGEGELKSGGFRRASILADALEAIIGAIFLDSTLEQAKLCVLNWYASRIEDLDISEEIKDPKTRLQEYLQERKLPLPKYTLIEEKGEPHNRQFMVACSIVKPKLETQSQATSKRVAEKQAAALILTQLDCQ